MLQSVSRIGREARREMVFDLVTTLACRAGLSTESVVAGGGAYRPERKQKYHTVSHYHPLTMFGCHVTVNIHPSFSPKRHRATDSGSEWECISPSHIARPLI